MRKLSKVLLLWAFALTSTPAFAGVLASDGSTYLGIWHGSTAFQGFDTFNNPTALAGHVDWAVYAPGTFPGAFGGYAPTPGEFVYAYQVFTTDTAPTSSLTVDLQNVADNIGSFTGGGVVGDAPLINFLAPFDSANWLFDGISQGTSSRGLAFSSPNTPILLTGTTIDDGSTAFVIPVPSPGDQNIPEPSTLVLAACGLLVGGFGLLRKRLKA